MKKLFFLLLLLPFLARAQSPTNPTGPIQSTLYKDASGSFWTYIGGGKWFEQVPLQTGQNGKVLGTNGTTLSWVTGGGGGGAVWGSITGTLSNQTDLQTALNALVPKTTTVAGFALSGNVTLASLTATDGTLTFSGAYNGSTARTVGLNVNNSNIWNGSSGSQTFNSIVLNDLPTGSAVAAPTQGGSVLQVLDINNNSNANNFLPGFANPGSGGLIVSSPYIEYFTNSSTTTCNLPLASAMVEGQGFQIIAAGTAAVNVKTHASVQIVQVPAGYSAIMTCILNSGTTAASWSYTLTPLTINDFIPNPSGSSGYFLTNNGAQPSWQQYISLVTSVQGILPIANGGNGSATPLLTAGTGISLSGSWPFYTISASGGSSYTAGNGITLSGSHFILGGTLDSANTQINTNGHILSMGSSTTGLNINDPGHVVSASAGDGTNNAAFYASAGAGAYLSYNNQELILKGSDMTVYDGTNLVGLITQADYSTNQRLQPYAYVTDNTLIQVADSVASAPTIISVAVPNNTTITPAMTLLNPTVTTSGSTVYNSPVLDLAAHAWAGSDFLTHWHLYNHITNGVTTFTISYNFGGEVSMMTMDSYDNGVTFPSGGYVQVNGQINTQSIGGAGTAQVGMGVPLVLKNYTVSSLPSVPTGSIAYVTDALTPVALATVSAGGSSKVAVFYNGTNWIVL